MTKLTVVRGVAWDLNVTTFQFQREGEPVDIALWSARIVIATIFDGDVLLDLHLGGAIDARVIRADAPTGIIAPHVSAAKMLLPLGRHAFHVEFTSGNDRVTTHQGPIEVVAA